MSAPTPPPAGGAPDPYAAPGAGETPPPGPAPTAPPQPYAQPYAQPALYPQPYAQPAPYGVPGAYPYQQPAPSTDGLSIAALVTGVVGIGPVALGLGIAGLRRTRRTGRGGAGLAVAGIVLGVLGTLAWLLLAGLISLAVTSDGFQEGFSAGYDETYEAQTGADLALGDCFELPDDVTDLSGVVGEDCASPHGAELVGVDELTDATFPGDGEVVSGAEDFCYRQFADYVGTGYDSSGLGMIYLYPTEASWNLGDRRVLCWAQNPDGSPLAGSVQGSGL